MVMRPDPVELLLSIAAYTQGNWSVEEVYDFYCYIWAEIEDLENPTKASVSLIKGMKHGEETDKQ